MHWYLVMPMLTVLEKVQQFKLGGFLKKGGFLKDLIKTVSWMDA